ncbi:ribosome-associated translation inhibitor RaiA [Candidatus Dependentiae bacterium]|nr:ribosome-associated translation inhibitor RaiA [Candidatus Dependentiae bacterium]
MDIKLSFHNMPHSDPIEQHTRQKLDRLHELLKKNDAQPPFHVTMRLTAKKPHPHHKVELHLKTSILDLNAHDESPDMYVTIDNTIDKMVKLVTKHKNINKDKQRKADTEKKNFTNNEDKYTLS